MSRHARQEMIIGRAAQARLAASHVLIIGAGGLGVPVLQYLAGAGIGRITLIDPDHVEESNLHRQVLYRMDDIGTPKAEAAARHLRGLAPALEITTEVAALTPSRAPELVAGADLVIDGADSFAVSYILSDACLAAGRPLVSGSVLGARGYAGLYCGTAPSLRAVFPDLPQSAATCASAGVLGPVVGMTGTLCAQLALAHLAGQEPPPAGRLISLDMENYAPSAFSFAGAPEPAQAWPFVDAPLLHDTDQCIDLRPETEAPEPFAPAARRALPEEVTRLNLDPARRVVLGCQTGLRSWRAAGLLAETGRYDIALCAAVAA
ncbi:ThiF family adenylyltransferase [Roseovarius sp. C7]|uniref:ThiF family adenylyltransferase n=1 Tax=Roseovarius sp. C7 TaxID=3398643 RepID=UPI0039F6D788